MGTRELLILILGLAVVAVILRGLYVAIHARRRQIRLAIDRNIPQDIDLEELELAELPSGGARVVKRSLASVNQQNALQNELDLGSDANGEQEAVPILLDTVEIRRQNPRKAAASGSVKAARPAPTPVAEDFDDEDEPGGENDSSQSWTIRDRQAVAGQEDQDYEDQDYQDDQEQWADPDEDYQQSRVTVTESDDESDDEMTVSQADDDDDYQDDYQNDYREDYQETASGSLDQDDSYSSEPDFDDRDGEDELAQLDDDEEDWAPASQQGEYDDEEQQERQEPRLDLDEDLDNFDDFSMTAGDRIGAPESDAPAGASRSVAGGSDTEQRKGKLFARFGKKDAVTAGERYQQDYSADYEDADDPLFAPARRSDTRATDRAGEQRQQVAASENRIQQDREPPRERQIAGAAQAEARRGSADPTVRTRQRTPAEHPGVTDFNQARESRRPASGNTGQNTSASAPTGTSRHSFEPSEVLVVNVMSREGEMFHGPELLQVLLAAGLKHGDMNIFHRQLGSRTDSPIVFSVANILNPGTFDLDNMEDFETRGVSLFLAMPAVISNREAFDDMLRTAQQIRAALGGELRDDHRSVMTAQTIEHYRQRIQDYELRKLKAAQAQS